MIQSTLRISMGTCYIKQAPENLNKLAGKTGQEKKKRKNLTFSAELCITVGKGRKMPMATGF